ncbi:MAG: rhodanese-like domain-containing protein [archaeon]|nr:rhodanese-like domain-containing protein [archaeon]
MKTAMGIILISLIIVSGCIANTNSEQTTNNESEKIEFSNISAQELNQKLENKDFFLLDVHIPEQEHIQGTDAFIPYNELGANLPKLPQDKSTPIVVYCRSGTMSPEASQKLIDLGYINVMNLEGGIKGFNAIQTQAEQEISKGNLLLESVAPIEGIVLPVKWNDVLVKTIEAGGIDLNKYNTQLAKYNTKLTPEHEKILFDGSDENIIFSHETALFNLNMLWALGLINDNPILTEGKISEYETKGRFASTGGWTLGTNPGGELLATAKIIELTPEQQAIVEEVTSNVYRPCCGNSTAFPDCNHGMAALALAELMASQGATKEQIYDALLVANSYWFTQTYVNTAAYLEQQGKSWENADAKEILGAEFSSYSGSITTQKALENTYQVNKGAGACGV